MCVCVCFLLLLLFLEGGGGGGGASPVQVKDSVFLIHGSLVKSSPYKTGVYIEYLLIILERDCSSMHKRKEDKLQH